MLVGEGYGDGPDRGEDICESGSRGGAVCAVARGGCVGACVLFAVSESEGGVLWGDLGCGELEDGGEEV